MPPPYQRYVANQDPVSAGDLNNRADDQESLMELLSSSMPRGPGGFIPSGSRLQIPFRSIKIAGINSTNVDLDQFQIAEISDPIVTPDVDVGSFRNTYTFKVNALRSDIKETDDLMIAIANGPIKSNGVGTFIIFGLVHCKVNIIDATDHYVRPVSADRTKLESCSQSRFGRFLWKPAGTGDNKECVIFLDQFLPVTNSGTYQYTVNMMVADNVVGWDYPRAHEP